MDDKKQKDLREQREQISRDERRSRKDLSEPLEKATGKLKTQEETIQVNERQKTTED